MKQIVIISGKGGTGKTVVTASFAALSSRAVLGDCDVDAADLHILLEPRIKEEHQFRSGFTAKISREKCTECGKCVDLCRFDAVSDDFRVDPVSCEGCAFCSYICPVEAIEMEENMSGEWFISETRFGTMVHARLGVAEENSGKLVSLVKEKAGELAAEQNSDWIIVDGAPGVGCPVIASLSGVDYAVVVTEPTLTGLHDADRVIKVAEHFEVPVRVIVNKYDLNPDMTERIEKYCQENGIEFSGKIPFDESVVKAMVQGKTVIEYNNGPASEEIRQIWDRLSNDFSRD